MNKLLEICTLGGLAIRCGGEPVTGFDSRKVEALLVYVACSGRTHSRDVLADLLWDELSQERAMGNLRVVLHSLRKHLEPYLAITRDAVALNPEAPVWLDAAEFEKQVVAGQIEEAVALYQGDFLAGFFLRGARGFEDWATIERERLRQRALDALGDLVARHLDAGTYKAGVPHARRLVQLDPYLEQAHRQLMRLLAYSGQRGAALAQYEACRQLLAEELGVEPTEETTALYSQIRAGELEPPTTAAPTIRGYELRERIGTGGFGEVCRAYQPSVGRAVAIKVILPQFTNHPEFIRRFEKEAQLVARLEHPHIVPLFDYWRDAQGAFLVMRWLRGGNLCDALRRGPWSLEAAAQLLDQVAGALALAHRQGVVHRDVKPENILLDQDSNAYLTDFGIAKDLLRATGATAPDAVPGSLLYISPEQAQGQPVTPLSDLYSLGVVMYEVLSGAHPFSDVTPADQLVRRLTAPLPPLRERRTDVPAALEKVIRMATARDPNERYPDALTFASAFRGALTGAAREAIPPTPDEPVLEIPSKVPPFLDAAARVVKAPRPVFVARQRELARLNGFLDTALGGQGQVVFVTGGAGRGKTALLDEFARRAMDKRPDLLAAKGNCNAYSGVGDPYLPFRDVMGTLTGDVEARWAAGAITTDHARRLWTALPLVAKALVERGPHLVDVFVSGAALLSRAEAAAGDGAPWLAQLRAHVEGQRVSSAGIETSHLFEQYTNVARALSEEGPLLLILDDVQWADSASISLLFHLGRRFEGSRVLIVCAYRPEEVALGRDGQRHPLEKALAEFKRAFGDVWVDLGQVEEREGWEFVAAFLEAEPNRLGEGFRQALFQHTGGHPLFTVELLRAMRERGDLIQDEEGRWIAGPALDWETLPARVEAVIEERIGRLEEELREILTVASVEGEEFTAQVVARVGDATRGERGVLRKLSQELGKRHRLVREEGELALGRRRLSRYRFAHALFQAYLYNGLADGERRLLHREIAAVLEELYGERTEEIAPQLAHHYAGAGDVEKERHHAKLAGGRAAAGFANEEALRYLSRALELTPETDHAERYALLLARVKVYEIQVDRKAQKRDLAALESLAEALDDDERRAQAALRRTIYALLTSDYPAMVASAQRAIRLAGAAGDVTSEAAAHFEWGRALYHQGDYEASQAHLERALALARAARARQVEADSLRMLGNVLLDRDPVAAAAYLETALRIHREIGDRVGENNTLNSLGLSSARQSDFSTARAHYERGLRISREIGDRLADAKALGNLGDVFQGQGEYARARGYIEQALAIRRETGFCPRFESSRLMTLGWISLHQGDFIVARAFFEQALGIAREIGTRPLEGRVLNGLGWLSCEQGDYTAAAEALNQALRIAREVGELGIEGWALCGLGLLCHQRGDDPAAREHCQQAAQIAQEINARPVQAHALTYLGHALAGLGHLEEPADVYRRALQLRRAIGQPHLATEPLAGLARIAMTQGDPAQAQAHVEEILSYLETGNLDGTHEPFRIYLTCFRVLRANQDPRAAEVLETAHSLLQERAANITDGELQRSFLENMGAHREILSEFAKLSAQRFL